MESSTQNFDELLKTLNENFNILADEVQLLSDRKTILEHKLRFAHEQYQVLADKYAPTDPEISSTLAKLQLPPDVQLQPPESGGFVPLPPKRSDMSKHQTAIAIRDGRLASKKITMLRGWSDVSEGINSSCSRTTSNGTQTSYRQTSRSTFLEQDFTVPGKKSKLQCPFAGLKDNSPSSHEPPSQEQSIAVGGQCPLSPSDALGTTVHGSADPVCLSSTEGKAPSATGSTTKCPIRFLDQQSPEEIARYFEDHKHEIPRSHEICVKRYQRNEQDLRKLDAKYGDLVSMIKGLGEKHQPMLPTRGEAEEEGHEDYAAERQSNDRVQDWANDVSADGGADVEPQTLPDEPLSDRESRFDRPLKEIRVGESPSRPWGIPVPYIKDNITSLRSQPLRSEFNNIDEVVSINPESTSLRRPTGKCPFGHGLASEAAPPLDHPPVNFLSDDLDLPMEAKPSGHISTRSQSPPPRTTTEPELSQPAYLQTADAPKGQPYAQNDGGARHSPQVIFSGPIFIGYPPEQAAAFMRELQSGVKFNNGPPGSGGSF